MCGCYKLESSLPRKLHTGIKGRTKRSDQSGSHNTFPINHEAGGLIAVSMLPEQGVEDGKQD